MNSNQTYGKVINLSSGKPISIKNITEKIKLKIGFGKPIYGKKEKRKYENMSLYANININKKYINWRPKINLENGLNKTIQYYLKPV